jgi:hypothetical protein
LSGAAGCSALLSFGGISDGPPPGGDASDVGSSDVGSSDVSPGADVAQNQADSAAEGAPTEASLPEAAADSAPGAPESGARDSASTDVTQEVGPLGFCGSLSPAPRFCDDFDEHPLPGVWDSMDQVGGNLSLDTTGFVSPPRALLATNSALQSGQPLDAVLRKRFSLPSPPTTFTWGFSLQPVMPDPSTGAAAVVLSLDFTDSPGNRYSVQFTMEQDGGSIRLRLEEQSGFVDGGVSYVPHVLPDPLPVGQWTSVQVVLTRSAATTASVHVSFGSATELDASLAMTVDATTLQMSVGSSYETTPSQGWTTRYDNVTLDY